MTLDRGFGACDLCDRLSELVSVFTGPGAYESWCEGCAKEAEECQVCESLSQETYEVQLPGGASLRVCSENCEEEGRREFLEERRTRNYLRGIR